MDDRHEDCAEDQQCLNTFLELTRACETLSARIARALSQFDLTMSQFGTLEALFHAGPMCHRDIGAKLFKSGGNITLVVKNLEERGLVERQQDETDRRYVQVSLTPAGRKLVAMAFPRRLDEARRMLRALTRSEQKTLASLCKTLQIHAAQLDD